jgi:hypothetical protein
LFIIFHIGHLVTGHLVTWSLGDLVTWSLGDLVTWSLGDLVIWSLGDLVIWLLGDKPFKRAHNNCAKLHYNHHRVQLITWSLVT